MRHAILTTTVLATLFAAACATTADTPDVVDDSSGGKADSGGELLQCTSRLTNAADVQEALDELGRRGGTAALCLGGTFEIDELRIPGAGDELRIIGEHRNATTLQGSIVVGSGWQNVRIERLTFDGLWVENSSSNVDVVNAYIKNGVLATTTEETGRIRLSIQRSEIGQIDDESVVAFGDGAVLDLHLVNNVIRGRVLADSPLETPAPETMVEIVNNTFTGARHLYTFRTGGLVANNLFVGATDYAWQNRNAGDITSRKNAYVNNQDDHKRRHNSSLILDCALDTSGSVPVLAATSTCRGGADPYLAPVDDYAGNMRDALPDIGAVEGWRM